MVIESFSEKKWFSPQGMACAVYEERKGGFPLRGRSRGWLTLLAAVECSMSSLAKPLREKPPSLYCHSVALSDCRTVSVFGCKASLRKTTYHLPFAIRHSPFPIRHLPKKEVLWQRFTMKRMLI